MFHIEIEGQIIREVWKLLAAGFIKPIQHPQWLSNIVPMKKKNGQIRCCVNFRNLNWVCPKDEFLLPNMDLLIDSAMGNVMFSFMDGFRRYNQIRMAPKDVEKTAFRTLIGNFYYMVMPLRLKNAGATYQILVNCMFSQQIGRNAEVYVDNMLVKSRDKVDHLNDLEETLNTLHKYKMKLNPAKCVFVVALGKFLGLMVSQ